MMETETFERFPLRVVLLSTGLALGIDALVALSFGGNAVVRGSFTCKYCKQQELGCPAQALFAGKET